MPKLKPLSVKQFISILSKLGYGCYRQKGSHAIFKNAEGGLVTVPIHSGTLDRNLMLKIIKKELRMSRKEFEKLV